MDHGTGPLDRLALPRWSELFLCEIGRACLGRLASLWAEQGFPANKNENRGAPALCVSGNFQGKQRVFGAPFWKLASFPESESWSGAKSEAKLRKSTKRYPGGRRVISRAVRAGGGGADGRVPGAGWYHRCAPDLRLKLKERAGPR